MFTFSFIIDSKNTHRYRLQIGRTRNTVQKYMYIRYKNPKIKNGFEYSGTQHRLQNYTLITML